MKIRPVGAELFHADRRTGHKEDKSEFFTLLRTRINNERTTTYCHTHVRQTQGQSTVTVYTVIFCFMTGQPLVDLGVLYHILRSHSDTPYSVGPLWTSVRLVAKTSTWQHTTLTTDRHPSPRRDSNSKSQQSSGVLVGSTPNQHTTLPSTRSDNYQKLYWYNLFLLMMSMTCSKHVENYK